MTQFGRPLLLSKLQGSLLNCSNMDLQHSCQERPAALLKFIASLLKNVYLLSVTISGLVLFFKKMILQFSF